MQWISCEWTVWESSLTDRADRMMRWTQWLIRKKHLDVLHFNMRVCVTSLAGLCRQPGTFNSWIMLQRHACYITTGLRCFFCDWKNSFHQSVTLQCLCVFVCVHILVELCNCVHGLTCTHAFIHEQHQQHMADVITGRRLQCNHITAAYWKEIIVQYTHTHTHKHTHTHTHWTHSHRHTNMWQYRLFSL